jgi:uncharacterized protein YeaO (DUF488 family)
MAYVLSCHWHANRFDMGGTSGPVAKNQERTMIKIKHFMDHVEADDGMRVWVEPVRLTKDLQEWCFVDAVLPLLGPSPQLVEWLASHPDGYGDFRGRYHDWLSKSYCRPVLQRLAGESARANFTLLHASDDADHNCATALKEFITELGAWCPSDD